MIKRLFLCARRLSTVAFRSAKVAHFAELRRISLREITQFCKAKFGARALFRGAKCQVAAEGPLRRISVVDEATSPCRPN